MVEVKKQILIYLYPIVQLAQEDLDYSKDFEYFFTLLRKNYEPCISKNCHQRFLDEGKKSDGKEIDIQGLKILHHNEESADKIKENLEKQYSIQHNSSIFEKLSEIYTAIDRQVYALVVPNPDLYKNIAIKGKLPCILSIREMTREIEIERIKLIESMYSSNIEIDRI